MKTSVLFAAAVMTLMASDLALAKKTTWKVPSMAARTKNPIAVDAKSLAAGKALYAKECASCHGASGRGDGAEGRKLEGTMPDLTDSELIASQSDGELFRKVTMGRRPMPGYKASLSDEQRWHLVNYMRAMAK